MNQIHEARREDAIASYIATSIQLASEKKKIKASLSEILNEIDFPETIKESRDAEEIARDVIARAGLRVVTGEEDGNASV